MLISSYSKINLFLHVGPLMESGYHEFFSLMVPIDFSDKLYLEKCHKKQCTIKVIADQRLSQSQKKALDIPQTENLIYKAWDIYPQKKRGLTIEVIKNVPPGGGLGGGSANAAAILRFLNEDSDSPMPMSDLEALAAQLGSDIPFFLHNKPMIAKGRGEILEDFKMDVEDFFIVLLIPDMSISTAWAYENVKIDLTPLKKQNILYKLCSFRMKDIIAGFDNAFRELLEREFPFYIETRTMLLRSGALLALPSGSGSSVFGVFDSLERAQMVVDQSWPAQRVLTRIVSQS